MAGVDFEVLRREIALAQVLNLLQWEPTRETNHSSTAPVRSAIARRAVMSDAFRSTFV